MEKIDSSEGKHVFDEIVFSLMAENSSISKGKMMHSDAICYKDQVIAFLSRKNTMVFRLCSDDIADKESIALVPFNPFKRKTAMKGWYELSYSQNTFWMLLTKKALEIISRA